LPELVAQLRQQINVEISEAVGLLRAEMNVQRSVDMGTVTELPAIPLRKPARDLI
jgi:hypothetical protein